MRCSSSPARCRALHLIVAHEMTNVGSDRSQLSRLSEQARAAIGFEAIEAVADGSTPSPGRVKRIASIWSKAMIVNRVAAVPSRAPMWQRGAA
jgi:hypothetical protein